MLRRVYLSLLFLGCSAVPLTSCRLGLKHPPAPPAVSPTGVWISRPEPRSIEILRIVCGGGRCWFRDVFLVRRDLVFSGSVINATERNGYLTTSADELLQIQTEYRSEQFQLPSLSKEGAPARSVLDRVVYGESRIRILTFDGKDRLVDGDAVFERYCPPQGDCSRAIAIVLEAGGSESGPDHGMALIGAPDLSYLEPGQVDVPPDLRPLISAGAVYFARSNRPVGTVTLIGAPRAPDLAVLYEARVSLAPGSAAVFERARKKQEALSPEKRQRIADIRQRLKSGAPVSREEMLEALDENDPGER